jgi:uncharacterized membrane protein
VGALKSRREQIEALKVTIAFLNEELRALEKEEEIKAAEVPQPVVKKQPVQTAEKSILPEQKEKQKIASAAIPAKKQKPPRNWEKEIGQVWLPRVFVFIMLLGIAWGFKAGVDAGILAPPIRIVLGLITAGALLFIGEKQIKQNRGALGLVLLGGSVTAFVLTTFAAHYLYHYLLPAFAFILNVAWIAIGIWLSHRHKSEWLAIFVGIGGYLVPFLIDSNNPNVYVFVGYEVLLYVSLMTFSMKQLYRWLYYTAFGMLHLTVLAYVVFTGEKSLFLVFAFLLQHVCLQYYVFKKRDFYFKEQLSILVLSVVFLFLWSSYIENETMLKVILAFLTIFHGGLYEAERRGSKNSLFMNIAFCLTFYALTLLMVDIFSVKYYALLWLIQSSFGLYLALKLKNNVTFIASIILYICGVYVTIFSLFDEVFSVKTLTWLVYLGTLVFFIKKVKELKEIIKWEELHIGSFVLFFVSIFVFISRLGYVLAMDQSFSVQQLTISSIWMIYAFALIIFGNMKQEKTGIYFGLGMIGLTLLKLFFFDLFSISLAIRSLLFIIVGTIGIFVSRVFYTKNKKEHTKER